MLNGVWNGQNIAIREKWIDHIWTPEEADALFAGKNVCVYGLRGKNGKTYDVKGKLGIKLIKEKIRRFYRYGVFE